MEAEPVIRIAILDDDAQDVELLSVNLRRYEREVIQKPTFEITRYEDAAYFLSESTGQFDIAFMDIKMPRMDGMSASEMLRQRDSVMEIVFVTNVSSCAARGYSVDAADFIVKPISYYGLKKALDNVTYNVSMEDLVTFTWSTTDGVYAFENVSAGEFTSDDQTITWKGDIGEHMKDMEVPFELNG